MALWANVGKSQGIVAGAAVIFVVTAAAAVVAAPASTAPSMETELRSQLERDPLLVGRSPAAARPLAISLFLGRPNATEALERWSRNESTGRVVRSDGWLLLCEEHLRRS